MLVYQWQDLRVRKSLSVINENGRRAGLSATRSGMRLVAMEFSPKLTDDLSRCHEHAFLVLGKPGYSYGWWGMYEFSYSVNEYLVDQRVMPCSSSGQSVQTTETPFVPVQSYPFLFVQKRKSKLTDIFLHFLVISSFICKKEGEGWYVAVAHRRSPEFVNALLKFIHTHRRTCIIGAPIGFFDVMRRTREERKKKNKTPQDRN